MFIAGDVVLLLLMLRSSSDSENLVFDVYLHFSTSWAMPKGDIPLDADDFSSSTDQPGVSIV